MEREKKIKYLFHSVPPGSHVKSKGKKALLLDTIKRRFTTLLPTSLQPAKLFILAAMSAVSDPPGRASSWHIYTSRYLNSKPVLHIRGGSIWAGQMQGKDFEMTVVIKWHISICMGWQDYRIAVVGNGYAVYSCLSFPALLVPLCWGGESSSSPSTLTPSTSSQSAPELYESLPQDLRKWL